MPVSRHISHHNALHLWASAVAFTVAVPAAAQESAPVADERSPYYIGISQEFTHDSNVYRTANGAISEGISITGLVAGLDQMIGRQHLFGDVSAQLNRYRTIEALDNKSYSVTAGLDWQTIEFLSGLVRYSLRNSLADFGTLDGSTSASDQTTQEFLTSIRYGLSSKLSFNGSYEYRSLEYANALYANRNYKQNAVSAGVLWGTPGLLTFGLAYRATKGRIPEYQSTPPFEDELDRRDIDFTTTWTPTGFSTLNVRISSTKETHSVAPNAEASGFTGAISWDYSPTAKLNFVTSIARDTGREMTFLGGGTEGSAPLSVDTSRISNSAQVLARYEMTSKVSMTGDARYRRGTLAGGDVETVTGYGLHISYLPTQSVSLGCNVSYEDRDTESTTNYQVTVAGCSAQFTLR